MLSATLSAPTQALRSGSSGMARTPRRWFSARVAAKGWPATCTLPDSRARWPTSASISSRWPLPETPATPTISPARTDRFRSRTALSPRSPRTVRPRTSSCTSPGVCGASSASGRVASSSRTSSGPASRPTMASASASGVVSATAPLCTRRPRRSTLTSSA